MPAERSESRDRKLPLVAKYQRWDTWVPDQRFALSGMTNRNSVLTVLPLHHVAHVRTLPARKQRMLCSTVGMA